MKKFRSLVYKQWYETTMQKKRPIFDGLVWEANKAYPDLHPNQWHKVLSEQYYIKTLRGDEHVSARRIIYTAEYLRVVLSRKSNKTLRAYSAFSREINTLLDFPHLLLIDEGITRDAKIKALLKSLELNLPLLIGEIGNELDRRAEAIRAEDPEKIDRLILNL